MNKFKKLCVFTKADGRMIAGKIGYVDDAGDYVVVADTNMYVSDHEDYATLFAASPQMLDILIEMRRELQACQAVINLAGFNTPSAASAALAAINKADIVIKAMRGEE